MATNADDRDRIPSFQEFIASVQAAKHEQFKGRQAALVAHEDSFAEMKNHILNHYRGVEVHHSFRDENDSIFDCIPVERQPALRGSSGGAAKPPDLPAAQQPAGAKDARVPALVQAPLSPNRKDRHGNVMFCPEGMIPMRRITLENMSRFRTLQDFFQKGPGGEAKPQRAATPGGPAATHRWAHAFQTVDNLGGHSFINVWDPVIGANQVFSLSQHWYVGGSGAGLQTAEVGWQVYPQMYGNTKPVFFIYWTADDYTKTGCYNLSCPAFVQTSNAWTIGGALAPVSTTNGPQYEFEVAYYLYQGRWWLYTRGTSAANAIGYYPVSIYNDGAMASHASEIDYGGETVGTTSWPPMGGGAFVNAGWQRAAYQRDIYYFPPAGGASFASLTPSQAWPQCYTVQVANFNAPWNQSFFYGGPGGTNC